MTDIIPDEFNGVRLAVPGDEDQIFGLLSLMHAETGLFNMSVGKVRDVIRAAIHRRPDRAGTLGMIGVIEVDDRIVATIGIFIGQHWYTDDYAMDDRWAFVHPDHRKSDYLKRLINFAKASHRKFSDKLSTPVPLFSGVVSRDRTVAKVRLYGRQMDLVGAVFMHGESPRKPEGTALPARDILPQRRSPATTNARH